MITEELAPYLGQAINGVQDLPLDVLLPRLLHIAEVADRALADGRVSIGDIFAIGRAVLAAMHEARREREARRPPPELARDPVETVTDAFIERP